MATSPREPERPPADDPAPPGPDAGGEEGAGRDPFDREPLCCLVGPTASGKTSLALDLCEAAGAEVLSLDSMLVYRGLDVGTAKPSAEERARVPHHLVDTCGVDEHHDVQRWLRDARAALADVQARGVRGLFVGGTGFYLAALLRGLFEGPAVDPEVRAAVEARGREVGAEALHAELARRDPTSAERLHPNDRRRVERALEVLEQTGRPLSAWQGQWDEPGERVRRARLVGLTLPVEELDRRIRLRTAEMLDGGWREEALRARAAGLSRTSAQALGYDAVLRWADGEATREETLERIALRTRQFARRQRTWYRKFDITWIEADAPDRLARARAALGW